jgi:AcrR family transcriptional regulator
MSRTYVSPLRHEQSEATRLRIIEAVARVLARGLTELSVPAVAREAGVSLATIYRHFTNKQELVAGLGRHYAEQVGMMGHGNLTVADATLDDFLDGVPEVFARTESLDPTLRAAITSEVADEYRRTHRPERLAPMERMLRERFPQLPDRELIHLRDLVTVLTSSAALRAFNTLIGSSAAQAGETVGWGLRRLLADTRPESRMGESR